MENKVKRVQFKKVAGVKGASLEYYQDEFDYLIYSGCTLPTKAISNPKFPLSESMSKNLIKLYFDDVGILTNLLYQNNIDAILNKDSGVNLGSVYETAVAMELAAHGHELYYFDSKKVGEVDFLVNDFDALTILPIEIKSGKDQYSYRAIPKLVDPEGKYKIPKGLRFGNKNITKKEGRLITYPIYMAMFI